MKLFCPECKKKNDVSDLWRVENQCRIYGCSICGSEVPQRFITQPLISFPFDEARAIKFQIGRAEHGPVFLNHPVVEIDMELIDAVNYAEEAIKQGYDKTALETIISKLKDVDKMVRDLYKSAP